MLYETKCQGLKNQHENKVSVAKMMMLRQICGKTRHDQVRNDNIRESDGVAPIIEKIVENRLRWFEYVEIRSLDSVISRVDKMERGQIVRDRGIPIK